MAFRTDNPEADLYRWEMEKERSAETRPVCGYCDERITDDFFYEIEGEIICARCLNEHFRKRVGL